MKNWNSINYNYLTIYIQWVPKTPVLEILYIVYFTKFILLGLKSHSSFNSADVFFIGTPCIINTLEPNAKNVDAESLSVTLHVWVVMESGRSMSQPMRTKNSGRNWENLLAMISIRYLMFLKFRLSSFASWRKKNKNNLRIRNRKIQARRFLL